MTMTSMDPENLTDDRALEVVLGNQRVTLRKIAFGRVFEVSDGRATIDILPQDVFLAKDGQRQTQAIRISKVPVCGMSDDDFIAYLPIKPGSQVLVLCADRSLAPFKDENNPQPAQNKDIKLHSWNGAFCIPMEIGRLRLVQNAPADTMIVGTKSETCRAEIGKAGTFTVRATEIKLGGPSAAAPVANATVTDQNIGLIAAHTTLVGSFFGVPGVTGLTSTALNKVKGE